MTEQELKKLRRVDLLEILLDLSKENEVLRAQLDKARSQLTSRTIAVEKSGSLAEAALRINGVFEAAQAACDQYTQNIQQRMANQDQACQEIEQEARAKAAQIVAEAELRAQACVKDAQQEADDYSRKTRSEADAYSQKIRSEADACSLKVRGEADEYSQKVRTETDAYRKNAQQVVKDMVSAHEWLMKGLQ